MLTKTVGPRRAVASTPGGRRNGRRVPRALGRGRRNSPDASDASESRAMLKTPRKEASHRTRLCTWRRTWGHFSLLDRCDDRGTRCRPGSPFDRGAGFYAIAVTTSGHFAYAADFLHGRINGYRIARSGALQPRPTSPVDSGGAPVGLTVDPAERFVFAASSEGPNRIFVYGIDRTSGALTPVDDSPFGTTDAPATLAVDPQSRFLFVSSRVAPGVRVFAIGDPSGALTEVAGSPFGKETVHGEASPSLASATFLQRRSGRERLSL